VAEINETLAAWLQNCIISDGPIVAAGKFRDNLEALKAVAGIAEWPHNGLRHSFASYHLAQHGNAQQTANLLGHKSQDIIHNHYKSLVLKSEAEKYWALRPENDLKKTEPKSPEAAPEGEKPL
jgi:integrase